jgi:hypothetical protein
VKPSDDGKVIDGKIVVWLSKSAHVAAARDALGAAAAQQAGALQGLPAPEVMPAPPPAPGAQEPPRTSSVLPPSPDVQRRQDERMATAKAFAASLQAAAKDGVPFCADCEAARKQMLADVE